MRSLSEMFKDVTSKKPNPDRRFQYNDVYQRVGQKRKPRPAWKQIRDFARALDAAHGEAVVEDRVRRNGAGS